MAHFYLAAGFDKVVQAVREHFKISREELASFFGVSSATVAQWEHGSSTPPLAVRMTLGALEIAGDRTHNRDLFTRALTLDTPERLYIVFREAFAPLRIVNRLAKSNPALAGLKPLSAVDSAQELVEDPIVVEKVREAFVHLDENFHGTGLSSWVIDECPFCGNRHAHGAGRVGEDPRASLGHRTPHCARDKRPSWGSYVLVEREA